MSLGKFLDTALNLGLNSVQMEPDWPDEPKGEGSLLRLKRLLDERGLSIVVKGNALGAGYIAVEGEKVEPMIAGFREKMEAAAYLGSPAVRLVARTTLYPTKNWDLPKRLDRRAIINLLTQNLFRLTGIAEGVGVILALENHGDLFADELLRLMKDINSPHLRVQLDLTESIGLFEDPYTTAEKLLPYTITVHFHNALGFIREWGWEIFLSKPEEGVLNLDWFLKRFQKIQRDLYIFICAPCKEAGEEMDMAKLYADYLISRSR